MTTPPPNPLRYYAPYIALFISGDDEGNARRQAEADHINRTTNRMVDGREVVNAFVALLHRNGIKP